MNDIPAWMIGLWGWLVLIVLFMIFLALGKIADELRKRNNSN